MGMDRKVLHGIECQAALLCHRLKKKFSMQWNTLKMKFY